MKITTQVTVDIPVGREQVFQRATVTENLPKIFPGRGPIPGIVEARVVGDDPNIRPGTVRRVKMTDGSELEETFFEFEAPSSYAYRMSKMKPPLSLMMTSAMGRWVFTEREGTTHIAWDYICDLRSFLAWLPAALVVKVFMKSAMQDCLDRLKAGLAESPLTQSVLIPSSLLKKG